MNLGVMGVPFAMYRDMDLQPQKLWCEVPAMLSENGVPALDCLVPCIAVLPLLLYTSHPVVYQAPGSMVRDQGGSCFLGEWSVHWAL